MTSQVKQVIVMRTDLNMRKGKMVAQGAHAAMAFLSRNLKKNPDTGFHEVGLFPQEEKWLEESFVKICLGANSLEELEEIYTQASLAGLTVYMVEDNGVTEFHGEKTKTCLCIGPNYSSQIDAITGHLKLL